ncbi:hypothetical protein MMC07_005305 [Pseudocyphellaria aurata]|nr:hypothetical protein [Pseudocyphellaria aurata]
MVDERAALLWDRRLSPKPRPKLRTTNLLNEPSESRHRMPHSTDEDLTLAFVGSNALEIAAIGNAKNFMSQRVVQKIVDDIWCGDIVFWESLSLFSKKKAQVYNKRQVTLFLIVWSYSMLVSTLITWLLIITVQDRWFLVRLFNARLVTGYVDGQFKSRADYHYSRRADPYSRLRIPKYQKLFEALFFVVFLALYYAVLVERNPQKITVVEVFLYIWIAAFAYNEFGDFQDAGTLFYTMDFWSFWDIGIVGIGVAYLVARACFRPSMPPSGLADRDT